MSSSKEIGFNAELRQAVIELAQARKDEKDAVDRKKELEKVLKAALGDATMLTIGGAPAVKLVDGVNSGISKELLAEILSEEQIASVTRTTHYKKLLVLDNSN